MSDGHGCRAREGSCRRDTSRVHSQLSSLVHAMDGTWQFRCVTGAGLRAPRPAVDVCEYAFNLDADLRGMPSVAYGGCCGQPPLSPASGSPGSALHHFSRLHEMPASRFFGGGLAKLPNSSNIGPTRFSVLRSQHGEGTTQDGRRLPVARL